MPQEQEPPAPITPTTRVQHEHHVYVHHDYDERGFTVRPTRRDTAMARLSAPKAER